MISKKLKIKNSFGENLEAVKEFKKGKKKTSTVILVPGLAMDYHEWGGSFDQISKHLTENGLLVYRFSFAGSGGSEGDFKEMTVTRQAKQVKDVVDFVRRDPSVDKKRIAILAQSMGGPSTIEALPLSIRALIFLSSPLNVAKSFRQILMKRKAYNPNGASYVPRSDGKVTPIGRQIWDDFKKLNLKTKLKSRSPRATLILHGTADKLVQPKEAELLLKYAKGDKEMVIYPKGDHGIEFPKKARREMLGKIVCWLKNVLNI